MPLWSPIYYSYIPLVLIRIILWHPHLRFWFPCDAPMMPLWRPRDAPIILPWCPYDTPVILLWCSRGAPNMPVFPYPHLLLVGCDWISCGLFPCHREALDELMEDAKCEIISTTSSNLVDAYVLRLVPIINKSVFYDSVIFITLFIASFVRRGSYFDFLSLLLFCFQCIRVFYKILVFWKQHLWDIV